MVVHEGASRSSEWYGIACAGLSLSDHRLDRGSVPPPARDQYKTHEDLLVVPVP
jgi:hypothetical protein